MEPPQAATKREEGKSLAPSGEASAASPGISHTVPGITVSDHELIQRIGSGSYGEVWLARSVLGQLRAVKLVYRSRFNDERPFEREFEGIERFEPISRSHPSQLAILHVGRNEEAGCFYYVMELADDSNALRGVRNAELSSAARPPTLHSALYIPHSYVPHTLRHDLEEQGRLPIAECVQIGLSLTTALAHLHQHGLVHRDVKPSNVLFVNGAPKLGDIGLVTEAGDSHSIVGTEGYLPPEGPGTPQADIFSLGKVLYEVSTGMDRRRFSELPEDLRLWPDRTAVAEFNEIVLKACAKDPVRRYKSADQMHGDLLLLQQGLSVKRKRIAQRWLSISKKTALALLAAAVSLATAVFLLRRSSETYQTSAIPEVNYLVEQGKRCLEGRTAERVAKALEYYTRAATLDSKSVPAQFGIFRVYLQRGGYERDGSPEAWPGAREGLRAAAAKLMQIGPGFAESRAAAALVNWSDWHFREGLADARLATQMRPASKEGRIVAYTLYGFCLAQTGHPDDALREYLILEKLDPAEAFTQHHLGHPYFVKHDFEHALERYQKSLDLEPRQSTAHYWKARVFEETGRFLEAIQEFEQKDANTELPNSQKAIFYEALREAVQQRGENGYWTKRLDFALADSRQDPYYLATLYARLGRKDEAYRWLEIACERKAFTEGLLFDLCWDQNDERLKAIARRIGLLQ